MRGRRTVPRTGTLLLCALAAAWCAASARAGECRARPCLAGADADSAIGQATHSDDVDLDGDSDSAPFMIVVEHEDGWRCSASLVSLRTGVTSARCARGHSEQLPRELWALAAALLARPAPRPAERHAASPAATARRVSRLALAGDPRRRDEEPALNDLAVLELEAPFGAGARARPILMATSRTECDKGAAAVCHAVRAVPAAARAGAGASAHRASFRVVDAHYAAETVCAARVPHWADVRDRAFCLMGNELCEGDRGTGVVCGGKLCGVLGESAGAAGEAMAGMAAMAGESAPDAGCGDAHVVYSVARWRSFLHCAHTLRACGRGECETLCSEHRLLETDSSSDVEATGPLGAAVTVPANSNTTMVEGPRRRDPATALRTLGEPLAEPRAQLSTISSLEFEPNRPDFRAGEYGDNAADYGEEAAGAALPTRSSAASGGPAPAPGATRTRHPAAPAAPAASPRPAPAPEPRAAPPRSAAPPRRPGPRPTMQHVLFVVFCIVC